MGRGDSEIKEKILAVVDQAEIKEWREVSVEKGKSEPSVEEREALKKKKEIEKKIKKKIIESIIAKLNTSELKENVIKKIMDQESQRQQDEECTVVDRPFWLDAPSGTRDFYPYEMRERNWLFERMKEIGIKYGFEEYDAPVLEHVELYERKAGEEISQQMYNFIDKENVRVCLRPEMTPSLARMVLNQTNLITGEVRKTLPLKWFSIPQCWRFETTQRGRKREHYQWNMDIVGESSITAEAELLNAICSFFASLNITADIVGIRINSRKVLDAALQHAGVPPEQFAKVCVIVDKLDKIGADAVKDLLMNKEGNIYLPEETAHTILNCLQAKNVHELASFLPKENEYAQNAIHELELLFQIAQSAGFFSYLIFDASVVRGLAYYTGIVFEAFDRKGQLRAICGGGRYDKLLALYGGETCQIPCCGFGFGDCVIMELLKDYNLLPSFAPTIDFFVAPFQKNDIPNAFFIASQLRSAGFSVHLALGASKKARQAFDLANRYGAKMVAFVAPDEWQNNKVRIKHMIMKDPLTGEGKQIDFSLSLLSDRAAILSAFADQAQSSVLT
uniref:histidine--tRNA ligase n=1 Tax=Aureoumbra lagunensis TaxID=44058 RepID=A0A7S3JY57_9STRA|mmetsp:Transcript_50/g.87  ORF Transcript_50/g.87 Transcript_50/m.87 type:complete len:562 (-) Transcript_50:124-1809(-)